MSSLALGEELGGYRLEQLAGRGGMGVVYRATQLALDRVVALKVIAPELASDPAFRGRFQREARLLAAVDHPHVIPVYEADEAHGHLFLSMRWVEGDDLAREIARTGALDPGRARHLLAQVAGALDAVHAHGLVHGDLKPANVLVEPRPGGDHAYLSDFGAGRQVEATVTGQWLGTVDYIAPETLHGAAPDARSDLYGLACVLFETLTGAPPFHRDTPWATMWAHGNEPPPSACQRRPALPRSVDAVLTRGLAKDPDARYASSERLAQALADALLAGRGAVTGAIPASPQAQLPAPAPSTAVVRTDLERDLRPARRGAAALAQLRRRRRRVGVVGAVFLVAAAAAAVAIAASGSSPQNRAAAPATIDRTQLGAGTEGVGVTANPTGAYVLDQFGQYVDVVTPGGEVSRIILPGRPRSLVLDPARKLLWVGLLSRRLVSVALTDRRVQGAGVALPIRPDLLAVLGDEVIAEQGNPAQLVRVDVRTGRLIGAPVRPGGSATSLIAYHGSLLSSLVFPARLEQFSASLQRTADHRIRVALPTSMAVDSLGSLWVTDYDTGRVWRLDPSDGIPEGPSLAAGQNPTGVAVSGDYVWVANAGDQTVTVINEQSDQVRGVPLSLGSAAGPIAGSQDATGSAWMTSGTEVLALAPTG